MEESHPPKWLSGLVAAKFYENCEQHRLHQYNSYCPPCNTIVCPSCSTHHKDHPILKVYKASNEVSIRKDHIAPYLDPSDLCVYRINRHDIVFLHQKRKSNDSSKNVETIGYCRICRYKLMQSHTNFCSIQCKVRYMERQDAVSFVNSVQTVSSLDEASNHIDVAEKPNNTLQGLRKRRRKALHPRRAPFF